MQARDRLIVAADLSDRDGILRLVDELQGVAGVIKIGLQAFIAHGPSLVREVVERGEQVFLDLKLHDIPNTVKLASHEAASFRVAMLTVHAAGGEEMMRAVADEHLLVLAVTILTSLDEPQLRRIGYGGDPRSLAVRMSVLAKESGLRGVVASPHEVQAIRERCGADFTIVTPGIRPAGAEVGDQRRTMSPRDAIRAGADFIVVGRPITEASNRRDAALRIVEEMSVSS